MTLRNCQHLLLVVFLSFLLVSFYYRSPGKILVAFWFSLEYFPVVSILQNCFGDPAIYRNYQYWQTQDLKSTKFKISWPEEFTISGVITQI